MELKQLEYFCSVVEAGSISEAARRLNMSQPPLSYHMKMLEEELHVTLFQRGRRKIELTDAGRLLYERAGTLIHLERAIGREVSGTGNVRTLRLGVTPTTVPLAVPALAAMNRMTNGLHFELFEGNTYQLREMLSGHLLDASFLRSPVNMDGFSTCRLKTEPLVAAGEVAFFSDRKYTDLQELAPMPLILYRRYDAFIRQAFYHAGFSPDIHCICDDARTAMMMVKEGMKSKRFREIVSTRQYTIPKTNKHKKRIMTNSNRCLWDDQVVAVAKGDKKALDKYAQDYRNNPYNYIDESVDDEMARDIASPGKATPRSLLSF